MNFNDFPDKTKMMRLLNDLQSQIMYVQNIRAIRLSAVQTVYI